MKRILLSFLVASFLTFTASSQITPAKQVAAEMSQGKANGWKIFIPKADDKAVNNAFKKWMKDYDGKVEGVKKSDDQVVPGVKLDFLGEGSYTLYYQTKETKEGTYLTTFVQMGAGYLTAHQFPKESQVWKTNLTDFARNLTVSIIEDELKKDEKDLKDKNKDLEKLAKDKEGYESDIKKAEETIAERKKQLEQNAKDQEKAKSSVATAKEKAEKTKAELAKYKK
jgi:hypothetical protein